MSYMSDTSRDRAMKLDLQYNPYFPLRTQHQSKTYEEAVNYILKVSEHDPRITIGYTYVGRCAVLNIDRSTYQIARVDAVVNKYSRKTGIKEHRISVTMASPKKYDSLYTAETALKYLKEMGVIA